MSITKNFLFSSVITVSNYVFPLITYPYVTRVLGVDNIGICNYVDGIIQYFTIFAMLGISSLGVREIASSKHSEQKLSSMFSSLLFLCFVFTLLSSTVLLISIFTVPFLAPYRKLLLIGLMKLIASAFMLEWYYQGIEDFKYITKRTLAIKLLYVASIFVFVRERGDYELYFILTVMMVVVNSIINIIHSRKTVHLVVHGIDIKPLLKPYFIMALYVIVVSLYTSFNIAYLGYMRGTTEVGYYAVATRYFNVLIAFYTAFTGVMIPRMSSIISEGKNEEAHQLYSRATNILITLSVPAILFTEVFVEPFVDLLCGPEFHGAYAPTRLIMPLLFIIGYEQILVLQILLPAKKDKANMVCASCGALLAIVLNVILVKDLGAIGSSIVWLASECLVLICAQLFVTKFFDIRFPFISLIKNILLYLPVIICFFVLKSVMQVSWAFAISMPIMLIYFIVVQHCVLHNEEIDNLLKKMHLVVIKQ